MQGDPFGVAATWRRTMRKIVLFISLVFVATVSTFADSLSAERLARIDRVFQESVDQSRLAGAVVLVLQDGKPVYERAFGWRDKEAGIRMTTDTVFRIASQTKALTSAAILSLMEEGKIGLNDPAASFIPTFAKTTVACRKARTCRLCRRTVRSPSAIC
jgi:CubicO group peptidase (beta-lactamase class C family)